MTSDNQIGTWVTCLPDSGCLETNLTFGILRMSLTRGKKLHICCLNNTFPQPCALLCAPFYTNIGFPFPFFFRLSGRFPHLCYPITMQLSPPHPDPHPPSNPKAMLQDTAIQEEHFLCRGFFFAFIAA